MEYLTRFIYTLIVIIISIPALSSVFIFFELELEVYGSYMMWMAAVAIFSSLLAPNKEVPKLIKLLDGYLKIDPSNRVDTIEPLSTTASMASIASIAPTAQVASNLVGNTTNDTTVIKNKSIWNNFLDMVSMGDVTDKETIRKVNPIYSSPKNTSIEPATQVSKPGVLRRMYAWGTKPLVHVESKLVGNMTNANTGIKKKPITDVFWDMVSRGNVSDNETTSNVKPTTNTQKNTSIVPVTPVTPVSSSHKKAPFEFVGDTIKKAWDSTDMTKHKKVGSAITAINTTAFFSATALLTAKVFGAPLKFFGF